MFIDGLGRWRPWDAGVVRSDADILALLEAYRSALNLRTDWRTLDKQEILSRLDLRISELKPKPTLEERK